MKKCIVISDSFKGTLSSLEICRIARESIPRFFPDCQVITAPVADGGEGLVECFEAAIGAQPVTVSVTGPLGKPVRATYARKDKTAIVEMAAAAGLPMMGRNGDPARTTTYGVGELIRHAIENGCTEILLGLGGSATNDGGCGCAAALGTGFYDIHGNRFIPTGATLEQIETIRVPDGWTLPEDVRITVMCDVTNPLYGPTGAAYVFAPQKGADAEKVKSLDAGLRHFGDVIRSQYGLDVSAMPGAGAAGGMGAGCVALLGAELRRGIEVVLDVVGFDALLADADLVITGEGRIDAQSTHGKVVGGVARRAHARGVPVFAIVGDVGDDAYGAYDVGVSAIFSINRLAVPRDEAKARSHIDYTHTLDDLLRCIRAAEQFKR